MSQTIFFNSETNDRWRVTVENDEQSLGYVWFGVSAGPATVSGFIPHDSAISIANALLSAAQASKEPA